ncbi:MAG: hypothetical protein ACKV2T_29470 [Kofleriaceae bacterium]
MKLLAANKGNYVMSRVRTLFASLALASSLLGCAIPHADARSTTSPLSVPIQVKPAPIVIEPVAPMPTRKQVRAKLAERRKIVIERFLAYREARVYPVNRNIPGAGHVWLDELGNLCAAATLIAGDWGRVASEAVSYENNNLALADVTKGELYNWILTSGLTKAEIVSIQVPGWHEGREQMQRTQEIQRLYTLYQDVERQINSLAKHNLDLAVDELMKHPQLARDLVGGKTADAGRFGKVNVGGIEAPVMPMPEPMPEPAPEPVAVREFAKPPQ